MKKILPFAVLLILSAAPQDPPKHGDRCSTACRKAIDKALKYLASRQEEDGGMPAKKGLRYVRTDATVTNVMASAVAGMAFLADGSTTKSGKYKKNLIGIRNYLETKLDAIFKTEPRRVGGGGGPAWSTALSLLFFTNLYEKTKSKTDHALVEKIVKYMSDCVGGEIMNTCWKKAKDSGTVWYVSGVTALTTLSITALARAKAAGFDVRLKMFELAKGYYERVLETNGSFKYDKDNMFPHEPRQGRSIAALLSLKSMGVDIEEKYAKTIEYARKNMDKTMTHHTPAVHTMLGAYTFSALGKDDEKKFMKSYHARLLPRQKEDGSVEMLWDADKKLHMKPNDLGFGASYNTAYFALILQMPKGKVTLLSPKKWY